MSYISATALAGLQRIGEANLAESFVIQRRTLEADGAGGKKETWDEVATVAGIIRATRRDFDERLASGREQGFAVYAVYLPAGTDVQAKDRITRSSDGKTYDVIEVYAPTYAVRWKVYASAVR